MAKKLVEAITSMEDDFAQWYTDVVKKAELCGYTRCKRMHGKSNRQVMRFGKISSMNWTADSKKQVCRMCTCRCLFRNLFCRKKKIT